MDKKIGAIIRQLETHKITLQDISEEIGLNKDIIVTERKLGLRKECNRGYDVIQNVFFVEEELPFETAKGQIISRENKMAFKNFEEYYEYLDGDIYDRACYKYCDFDKYTDFFVDKNIDLNKLMEKEAFISETIDDVTLNISKKDIEKYAEGENNKRLIKEWIKKFDACGSGDDLANVVEQFKRSNLNGVLDVSFFFYDYMFNNNDDENRFNALMEYMCTGKYPAYKVLNALCSVYSPTDVIAKYNYSAGEKQTNYKHKRKLKEYVQLLESGKIRFRTKSYFDEKTHFYYEEVDGAEEGRMAIPIVSYQRCFEDFEEFAKHRNNNLKGVDLSADTRLDIDFSMYEIDQSTKLPFVNVDNVICTIDKKYENGKFVVCKEWRTKEGNIVKQNTFSTLYFFDFVYYLRGNLEDAFLLFCDGLENLNAHSGIDFSGAKMRSCFCDKFGIEYNKCNLNFSLNKSFSEIERNKEDSNFKSLKNLKKNTTVKCQDKRNLKTSDEFEETHQKIYYVTDLHLMHRLQNAECRSEEDVQYVLQKIVDNLLTDVGSFLLIGGDVSSDFTIFKMFIKLLGTKNQKRGRHIVFVLGNHELWEFQGKSVDEIAAIYRNEIEVNGMYLLHNELLYNNSDDKICKISYNELLSLSISELRTKIQSTRIVVFGGLAFSGYNNEFNALQGIYRKTLERDAEIAETLKFENLYNKIVPCINDKNTIIFTHTPLKDWKLNSEPDKKLVYISGHTHRNEFYDDGKYRIYCDNQIGYYNKEVSLKYLWINKNYDLFSDYQDGIYKITDDQYKDFYKGKNIQMHFGRDVNVLYMLKKSGYYCFIHKSKSGKLAILNGGSLKNLDCQDVKYYYKYMNDMISYIKNPLDKYMKFQQQISKKIIKIGGDGTIHGCIIDIDFENHIYMNPWDLTVTGYSARNMICKKVYIDMPTLLKSECPILYRNYMKLIEEEGKMNLMMPATTQNGEEKLLYREYTDTDIYKVSREVKKMQRLNSNILSAWYDNFIQMNLIMGKNDAE